MRRPVLLALFAALLVAGNAKAGTEADLVNRLTTCWGNGARPDACEPLAHEVMARPRDERTRIVSGLARAEPVTTRTLGLWLAVTTRTAFDEPTLAETLLKAVDVRVVSYALEYLQLFHAPVHASLVVELAEKSPVPNLRASALRLLPDLDPAGALPAARAGLRASAAVVQAAAAGVVGRLKDVESVDALVGLLSDPRRPITVRLEAIEALRRIGDPTVAALLYLHFRWPEAMLTRKLVVAFGETAPQPLAPFLTDELGGELSREAIVSLARLKNPETTQALLGLFERPDVREPTLHLVFWALGEMRDAAAVPALLSQLRAGDPERATRAAEALGNIGARSAVRPLIEQLANPEARVTDMVAWALEKITGETFEKDRAQWDAWLEQNPY